MPTAPTPTRAGITTAPTGERHIPASTRPDGSTRREIRVRPGYRPAEDVEVYKNRTAESWKARGSGGIPGASPVEEDIPEKNSNNKNAKRREARKKAKAAEEEVGKDGKDAKITKQAGKVELSWRERADLEDVSLEAEIEEAEKERKVKRLKKKLREAREVQVKKKEGQELLPEQFEKAFRIKELIRDLEKLGITAEEEKIEEEKADEEK